MVTKSSEQIIDSRFLQTCDIPVEELIVEPFTMVIFGGAGDLSKRKLLPSVFHLYGEGEFSKSFSVIGFDRVEMTDEQYRNLMGEAVKKFAAETFEEDAWEEFSKHLFYLSGDFEKDESFNSPDKENNQGFGDREKSAEGCCLLYGGTSPGNAPCDREIEAP